MNVRFKDKSTIAEILSGIERIKKSKGERNAPETSKQEAVDNSKEKRKRLVQLVQGGKAVLLEENSQLKMYIYQLGESTSSRSLAGAEPVKR